MFLSYLHFSNYVDNLSKKYIFIVFLLVEDELATRKTLKNILKADGYTVHETADGAEIHYALSEHNIKLIIMGISLPGKMACCWRVISRVCQRRTNISY